jgi:hypothetical protein
MAKRKSKKEGLSFVIEFPLLTKKEDETKINKIFDDLTFFYNRMVKKYIRRIYELGKQNNYKDIKKELYLPERKKEINKLLKDKDTSDETRAELKAELEDIKQKKHISKEREEELNDKKYLILKSFHLDGEFAVHGSIKNSPSKYGDYATRLRHYISKKNPYLTVVFFSKLSEDLWNSINKKLYGKGKKISYKNETNRLNSFCGKYQDGKMVGIRFNTKTFIVSFGNTNGNHIISVKADVNTKKDYELECIKEPNVIRFGRIVRKKIRGKDKFYIQLSIEGKIPAKKNRYLGDGTVGLDIGTQTLATVSDSNVTLCELADRVNTQEHKIALLQRKMDRSKVKNNPLLYTKKGQIVNITDSNKDELLEKGVIEISSKQYNKKIKYERKWNYSNKYKKNRTKVAELKRKQAATRKLQHNELSNQIIKQGNCFRIEDMRYKSMVKRAKETTKNKKTGKYNSKKRFGKSIGNKAPAMFMTILENKAKALGGTYEKVNQYKCKPSQYNHFIDDWKEKDLKERWNNWEIDGKAVETQRDMYSAFVIKNIIDLEILDRDKIQKTFPKFKNLHDAEVKRLRY